jgi:hypothetical protein
MSIYNQALLQELGLNLTRVINSSLLNVCLHVLLTPAAQSAHTTTLATQLLVSICIFANPHPTIHADTTSPDVVINMLLLDLLNQGTISQTMPHY